MPAILAKKLGMTQLFLEDGRVERVTQKGLEVVQVDAKQNLLLVRGSVPGPRNGVVEVRTDG